MRKMPFYLLVPALGALALGAAHAADEEPMSIRDALVGGTVTFNARYRYEFVDQATFTKESHASTLRAVLGYGTKSFHGLSGYMEYEGVFDVGSDDNYRNVTNGKTNYPLVADAPSIEVNQVYGTYICPQDKWKTKVLYGRREVILGNTRMIGNVGWRQDHQNFDGGGISTTPYAEDGMTVKLGYDYLSRVNRIFPQDTVANPFQGRLDMNSHLLQGTFGYEKFGSLLVYGILLDYDPVAVAALSSSTIGARVSGAIKAADAVSVLYGAEFATQSDYGDNPNSYDANYYQVELGIGVSTFQIKLGYQVLEGDGATKKFTTPLATGHAFDGWADVFLNTPNAGLETTSITVAWMPSFAKGLKLMAVGHSFSGQSISDHFGNELDLLAEYKVPQVKGLLVGVKAAFFDGDETANMGGANASGAAAEEITKFWAYTQFSF